MQSLGSYGSSDESDGAEEDSCPAPVAGPSTSKAAPVPALPTQIPAELAAASPAQLEAPPSLNRVKGTTTSHSPLSGIKPLHSPSTQRAPLPSPTKEGKRRESSASPPPYAASPAPGSTNGSGSATPVPSSGVRLDSLAEFGVPRMTTGPCNPSVQAKLANFHHLALTRGLHFNDSLSSSKAFRNPRIYTKLVEFVKVDETGTNWDPRIWDPKNLPADADAARIADLQRTRSEAKAAVPAGSRSGIVFAPSATGSRSDDQARIRDSMVRKGERREKEKGRGEKRSRWDTGEKRRERSRSRSPRRR